jgi:hydroxyacylglutathione hydrolase
MLATMEIVPLRAFRDNYIWLMRRGHHAAVVDPGDAAPVLDFLDLHALNLSAILVTHHHADHTGGISDLRQHSGATVFGPARENIAGVDVLLGEPATLSVPGVELDLAVLDVPGHTGGHIAYYGPSILFCGDTLFGCGCGRLFEGTAEQMWRSLSKLAALPGDTLVYCAHEYTQANIDFSLAVDPDNHALQARDQRVTEMREQGHPSVPSTMAEERATNPFLRVSAPTVIAAASRYRGRSLSAPVDVFAAIREWKNNF